MDLPHFTMRREETMYKSFNCCLTLGPVRSCRMQSIALHFLFSPLLYVFCEGALASWLQSSTSDRAVRVRALAGDIVLCSWARHFTLTVLLSTVEYKWVPANLILGVTLRWTRVVSCYRHAGLIGHLARMQTLPYMLFNKTPNK